MSDDLDAVIREMWPGLEPGERYYLDGVRLYPRRRLDDRRLQAVPDKEQSMDEVDVEAIRDREFLPVLSKVPVQGEMRLADALAAFAETVGDAGHINADVHGLPIQFFGRDDIENVNVLVSQGRVLITGQLVIGGHRFLCFSKGFPMGAE